MDINNNQCCIKCGTKEEKLYYTFGKLKCKKCIEISKTGRIGHSGMIYKEDTETPLIDTQDLTLIQCKI